jgi:hypothetical protein
MTPDSRSTPDQLRPLSKHCLYCAASLNCNERYAQLAKAGQLRGARTQLAIMATQLCDTDRISQQHDHTAGLQWRSQQPRRSPAALAAVAGSSYWRVAIWLLLLCLLPGSKGVHVQVSKSMKDHLKQVRVLQVLLMTPPMLLAEEFTSTSSSTCFPANDVLWNQGSAKQTAQIQSQSCLQQQSLTQQAESCK